MRKNRKYLVLIGILIFLFGAYFVADAILFNGIRPQQIQENGFQAKYFAQEATENKVAVLLVGGGQWGDYWAQEFARREMVGLSVPYTGLAGLPKLAEEIKLEYFENALNWLKQQPEVNPNKIIVMGASRNAELAILLAATFPESISGLIAFAPSAVSWSNTVLPFSADEIKPSWTYKGVAIPYLPMNKINGNETNEIEVLDYWKNGLSKQDHVEKAALKIENVKGPILLFSGNDDKVWPAATMADMIQKRASENDFKFKLHNIKYENAGHMISGNPDDKTTPRTGTIHIKGKNYQYKYGGTDKGDYKAKQDAKSKLLKFLESL